VGADHTLDSSKACGQDFHPVKTSIHFKSFSWWYLINNESGQFFEKWNTCISLRLGMFYDMSTLCRGDILAVMCPLTTPLNSTLSGLYFMFCEYYCSGRHRLGGQNSNLVLSHVQQQTTSASRVTWLVGGCCVFFRFILVYFLFCMFYGGGLASRLQGFPWEMEKDKIFVQRMHLFPSKTPSVLSCDNFFKKNI
jgi:hypothetical protein